jgi:hypothetical protein
MTTKQLKNFPGAAQIGQLDLIYMAQSGSEVAATPAQVLTYLLSVLAANLPTTLPATSGVVWNNNGVLSIS